MSAFANPTNLGSIAPVQGFRLDGQPVARLGASLDFVGDVNGDGFDDLVIGAPTSSNVDPQSGSSWLVFGRAGGFGNLTLDAAISAGTAIRIDGQGGGNNTGNWVSAAGDVNGDGFADFLVTAPLADNGGTNTGATWLIFGKAAGWSNFTLTGGLSTVIGVRFDGQAGSQSGWTAAGAGDVNGDGFADIVIGAPFAAGGGEAWLVFGKNTAWTNTALSPALAAQTGVRIVGVGAVDFTGWSVNSAGDLNGDGFADLAIGAPFAANNGNSSGSTYIVFGKAGGWGTIDLATALRFDGGAESQSGRAVASAGDVNGDGFMDLLIGAPSADVGGSAGAGVTWLVFGKAGGWTNLTLPSASPADAIFIAGPAAAANGGWAVSAAGDVNGDGYADLLTTAPQAGTNAGASYMIFGRPGAWTSFGLAGAVPSGGGSAITGAQVSDQSGRTISAGDINGDGRPDLAIGAPFAQTGGSQSGAAWVLLNQGTGAVLYNGTTLADSLDGTDGNDLLRGFGGNDQLNGAGGHDVIEGGAGNDRMDGGTGYDTASYAGASFGVTVSLALQGAPQNTIGAGFDTLLNIEALAGSGLADTLIGDAAANVLSGARGNDLLSGGLGDDRLEGGAGIDTATLAGNRAAYTLTKNAGAGWTVSGAEGTDTLLSVERLQFADGTVRLAQTRPEDFSGRGFSDLLWQNPAQGWLYMWQQDGATIANQFGAGTSGAGWSLRGRGDLDGSGTSDLLWQHVDGRIYGWLMDGGTISGQATITQLEAGQSLAGIGDTDGDGRTDFVIRGPGDAWAIRRMDGFTQLSEAGGTLGAEWELRAVGDFNGDLKSDLLWQSATTGEVYAWQMDGAAVTAAVSLGVVTGNWRMVGPGDLDGDGRSDLVWQDGAGSGQAVAWLMNGPAVKSYIEYAAPGADWTLRKVDDWTGDDQADLLWQRADGELNMWLMEGGQPVAFPGLGTVQPSSGWVLI